MLWMPPPPPRILKALAPDKPQARRDATLRRVSTEDGVIRPAETRAASAAPNATAHTTRAREREEICIFVARSILSEDSEACLFCFAASRIGRIRGRVITISEKTLGVSVTSPDR